MASKQPPQVLNTHGRPDKAGSVSASASATAIRLHPIRLLRRCTKWKSSREEPKVAQYRNRKVALLHLMSHLIPIAASLTLVVLNIRTTFVGSVTTTSLTAIQFASKLLETLIQASTAAMVLSNVRAQVLGMTPFPLWRSYCTVSDDGYLLPLVAGSLGLHYFGVLFWLARNHCAVHNPCRCPSSSACRSFKRGAHDPTTHVPYHGTSALYNELYCSDVPAEC